MIIFLSMLMIVRERRREIGVLKAIGSSNAKISWQFVSEALTLTGMAAVVGVVAGVILSNPVLDALVSSSSSTASGPDVLRRSRSAARWRRRWRSRPHRRRASPGASPSSATCSRTCRRTSASASCSTACSPPSLIAVVGTAFPSWLIAKIRPAEVMRTE